MKNPENFLKWFDDNSAFFGFGEYFESDNPPQVSLLTSLALNPNDLKSFTKDALEYLDQDDSGKELKLGFQAYSQFQDILNIVVHDEKSIWNRHYCYYESLVYLRESVVSWLDKNILAGMALLRPFLELAMLHVYWYLRCERVGYDNFYRWLKGKKEKPPFKNQLDYIFDNLPSKSVISPNRLNKLKESLYGFFKAMSTYNHTPKIDESLVNLGGGLGNISLDSFYYYLANVNMLLRQIVYLYILAYPMALFPVDRYSKWGISGPMGLFFDFNNTSVIKAYLGEDNIVKIQKKLPQLQDIENLLSWYEKQPKLSDAQIEADWQDFLIRSESKNDTRDKRHRIAMHKAYHRGLGWVTNYFHNPSNIDEEISDETLEKAMKYLQNW